MKLEYAVCIIFLFFLAQFAYGMAANPDSEFGGTDGASEDIMKDMNPDFEPWDYNLPKFQPPGAETESLLFALQAAIGSLIIGYFFGYYKGKNQKEKSDES